MGSPATTLRIGGIVRIVYGVLALLLPRRMFAAFGFGEPEPDVRYFNALFGGRDIVVGLWILKALTGRRRGPRAAGEHRLRGDRLDRARYQSCAQRGGLRRDDRGALAFNIVGWLSWLGVLRRR